MTRDKKKGLFFAISFIVLLLGFQVYMAFCAWDACEEAGFKGQISWASVDWEDLQYECDLNNGREWEINMISGTGHWD